MKQHYIKSKKFIHSHISLGFFTRQGGCSVKNFSSLNCSYNSGDNTASVKKNIFISQTELSMDRKKLKLINQIHSNKTIVINKHNYLDKFEADGMITQDKDINIAVLTADCCPIFIFDDENKFICCLHVGWKGAYYNIIKNTIDQIIKIQPNLNKIKAIIGPCLNKKNFEVSNDFKSNFIKINSNYKDFFNNHNNNNKVLFDMRNLIQFQLICNRIINIEDLDIDTYSNENLFFSHRRSTHLNQLPTGRMVNIIGFNN